MIISELYDKMTGYPSDVVGDGGFALFYSNKYNDTHTIGLEKIVSITMVGAKCGISLDSHRWNFQYREYSNGWIEQGDVQAHNNIPPYLVVYMWQHTT